VDGLRVTWASVLAYDAVADTLVLEATSGASRVPEKALGTVCSLETNIGEWRILSQPNVVVEEIGAADTPADRRETMAALGEVVAMSVPLWFNEKPLGILRCSQETPRVYSRSDIEFATSLGQQAALVLNNACIAKGRKTLGRRLQGLVGVCRALTRPDPDAAMTTLCEALLSSFDGITAVDVYEYLSAEDLIRVRWSHMPDSPADAAAFVGTTYSLLEKPTYRRAFLSGRVVEYHVDDERFACLDPELCAEMKKWGEHSVIEVGMVVGDVVVGLLSIGSTHDVRYLDAEEKEILLAFAALGARLVRDAREVSVRS
jgi:transcriptional regulator with GAF, ATPase, and Fis domain